jgi:gamma-glutamylcyclotransferase (GGCT)/AIG2-like uncharacterized protein YtfP
MNPDKRLAVYGTLRSGQALHWVWEKHAVSKVGLVSGFGLVVRDDLAFPIAKWTGIPEDVIVVEILKFKRKDSFEEVLNQLDVVEGHPLFYRRQIVEVGFASADPVSAWMYVGAEPDMFTNGAILEDGDWCEFVTGLPTVME